MLTNNCLNGVDKFSTLKSCLFNDEQYITDSHFWQIIVVFFFICPKDFIVVEKPVLRDQQPNNRNLRGKSYEFNFLSTVR